MSGPRALVLLLLLPLAACPKKPVTTPTTTPEHQPPSNNGGTSAPHEVMATLERTACYGWCPIYKVTVYRDGAVEYAGEEYVKVKGKAEGHLDADHVEQLAKLFADNGYLQMKDAYDNYEMTDMPSANTSFDDGEHHKAIAHYYGDSSAPAGLGTIEDGFDRIVGTEQWVGTEDERQHLSDH